MAIETLDDILEELADRLGLYGCTDKACLAELNHELEGHPMRCFCRMCFRIEMTRRITAAVEVEQRLQRLKEGA